MSNIRWGLGNFLPVIGLFAGIAVVLRLVIGKSYAPGRSLMRMALDYALFGLVSGTLVGVCRPLTRTMLGAAVLGAVLDICLGVIVAMPIHSWDPGLAIVAAFVSVGGAFLGTQIWRSARQIDAKRRAERR
jgi:hypothetical protein